MNHFSYRVYYEFQGWTHCNPFALLKSDRQIADALANFVDEVVERLPDKSSQASSEPSTSDPAKRVVTITTTDDKSTVDQAVQLTLKSLELLSDPLPIEDLPA